MWFPAPKGLAGRTMKRMFRWAIRISLTLLAALIVLFGALLIYEGVTTGHSLLIAILIQPLVANTRPPPIAEDQLTTANLRTDDVSRNLSTLLQRTFPAGSS